MFVQSSEFNASERIALYENVSIIMIIVQKDAFSFSFSFLFLRGGWGVGGWEVIFFIRGSRTSFDTPRGKAADVIPSVSRLGIDPAKLEFAEHWSRDR